MSFAAEIKDFLGAYTTIDKSMRENRDTDSKIADRLANRELEGRKITETGRRNVAAEGLTGNAQAETLRSHKADERDKALRTDIYGRAIKVQEQGNYVPSPDEVQAERDRRRGRALPVQGPVAPYGVGAQPADPSYGVGVPTQSAIPVGPQPGFADGGAVQPPQYGDATMAGYAADSTPTPQAVPAPAPEPPAAAPQQAIPAAPPADEPNPVKMGLDTIMKTYKLGGGATALPANISQSHAGVRKLSSNADGASEEEVAQMNKIADPDGKQAQSDLAMIRLDMVVDHYLKAGEPDKAAKAAAALLIYGKKQTQTYGEQAVRLLKAGKTEDALDYLKKAYDQVPDGKSLDAKLVDGQVQAAVVDDKTGDRQDLGAFDTQHVLQLALGVANGHEYMQHLIQLAGPKAAGVAPAPRAAAAPKANKYYEDNDYPTRVGEGSIDEKTGAATYKPGTINGELHATYIDVPENGDKEATRAAKLKSVGLNYKNYMPEQARIADQIQGDSGYRGDPRPLANFVSDMTLSDPSKVDVKFDPKTGTAMYQGQTIPITPEVVQRMQRLHEQVRRDAAKAATEKKTKDAVTAADKQRFEAEQAGRGDANYNWRKVGRKSALFNEDVQP